VDAEMDPATLTPGAATTAIALITTASSPYLRRTSPSSTATSLELMLMNGTGLVVRHDQRLDRSGRPTKNGSMTSMKDLDRLALALPETQKELRDDDRPAYLIAGKLFCFHRVPRKDALDDAGERLDDVLAFRLADEEMKTMWLSDERSIFFTTDHFNGHPWILLRIGDLARVEADELRELVSDAWLARAPARLAQSWLAGPPT
jgi:hypothetical protein